MRWVGIFWNRKKKNAQAFEFSYYRRFVEVSKTVKCDQRRRFLFCCLLKIYYINFKIGSMCFAVLLLPSLFEMRSASMFVLYIRCSFHKRQYIDTRFRMFMQFFANSHEIAFHTFHRARNTKCGCRCVRVCVQRTETAKTGGGVGERVGLE